MCFLRDIVFFITLIANTVAVDFCYEDENCHPFSWGDMFPSCLPDAEAHQSPINLGDNMMRNYSLEALTLTGFDNVQQGEWYLKNNGHTIVLDVKGELFVSGGGLPGTYKTLQIHFHWGSPSTNGSEHTLNNRRYPMEMHIVSMKTMHHNMTSALKDASGLAVLGVFIDVSDVDNDNFTAISNLVPSVAYKGETVAVKPFPLLGLLPSQNISQFYRYHGSLTTPPCNEAVMWTVYEVPIRLSHKQITVFTSGVYQTEEGSNETLLRNNFRFVHDDSGRGLYASRDATLLSVPSGAKAWPCHTLALSCLLLAAQLL